MVAMAAAGRYRLAFRLLNIHQGRTAGINVSREWIISSSMCVSDVNGYIMRDNGGERDRGWGGRKKKSSFLGEIFLLLLMLIVNMEWI